MGNLTHLSSKSIKSKTVEIGYLYFANPFANVDPLFAVKDNKFTANEEKQICEVIENNVEYEISKAKKMAQFCGEYFSPLNVNERLQ